MNITVRAYKEQDLSAMIAIWNEVVKEGNAFPQDTPLTKDTGADFFASQSYTGVAETEENEVVGVYILHPNNVGRCGHICNASYAVKKNLRKQGIGEKLVTHCINQGKCLGFRVLQFNAVVKTNLSARHLYERLGFTQLGTIPKGFLLKSGEYEDICPYFREL